MGHRKASRFRGETYLTFKKMDATTIAGFIEVLLAASGFANLRRFQADTDFVIVSFDLMRRKKVLTNVNIRATRTTWERTRDLLESITSNEFEHAIRLQQHHQPIQNPSDVNFSLTKPKL